MNHASDHVGAVGERPRLIRAAAILDAAGYAAAPGAILLRGSRIVAAGSPQHIGQVAETTTIDLPDQIVLPAMVNAHAHLDLSHMGPMPFEGSFADWIDQVRSRRLTNDSDIARSVETGVRLSRAGGTAAIGDISGAGSVVPIEALRRSGMPGVGFIEVFGMGCRESHAIAVMTRAINSVPAVSMGVKAGLQPHAPYSCGAGVFRAAFGMGVPVATHLSETLEELEFVRSGSGALQAMLHRFNAWDDSIIDATNGIGSGLHPIDLVLGFARDQAILAAHVNYADDEHVLALAASRANVAFCPRASEYFGHHDHPYRRLLDAGVNVALGTDSLACLDTPNRISVVDEMRCLHRRSNIDGATLLKMATVNGARALGLKISMFTLTPGESAGLIALPTSAASSSPVNALHGSLRRDAAPTWVLGPIAGSDEWFER